MRRRRDRAGRRGRGRPHADRPCAAQQRGLLSDAGRPVHDRRRHGRRRRRRGGLRHVRPGVRRDRPDPQPRRRRPARRHQCRQHPHPRARRQRPGRLRHGHHRDGSAGRGRRPGGAGERRRQPRVPAAGGRPATSDGGSLGGGRAGSDRPDLRLGGEQPSAAKRGHAGARRRSVRAGRHLLAGGAGRRPGAALQRRPHRHGAGGGVRQAAGVGQGLRADRARPGAGGPGTGRRGQRHNGAVPDRSPPVTRGRSAANRPDPGSRPRAAGRGSGREPQTHPAAGPDDAGRDRNPGRGQHLLPALGALRGCRPVEWPCRRLPGRSRRPVRRRQALPRGVRHAHLLRGARPGHPPEAVRPHDPLRRERPLGCRERRQLWPMRSARFRELWNLLAVAVLTGVGFLSVYTARQQEITSTSLIYAAFFLALYFVAHLGLRAGLPDADPWLLPLSALLTAMGLTEIYRLNPLLARDQSIWIVVGLGGFLALILLVGDARKLESYKYTLGVAAVALLVITMLLGTTINGAKLWLRVGGVQVQPGEFAKLLLVIFLAGYLREKRELLTMAHRRIVGVGLPAARHLGPLLAMTGVALGVVAVMNDMGTALLLYGIFLAMVYIATGRQLYTVAGLALFVGGSFLVYHVTPHVQERFQVWLDPWKTPHTNGYQIIQSIESIADGGIFGSGLGRSFQVFSNGSSVIPAAQTDGIYAVWANETGLAGAAGMLLIYLLFAYRGFKIASVADDSFSKLLAAGLTFTVVLQAFLIVGGITRLIPLTGITLPFVSYGGSSVVSNFMLLALLLMVSSRTARVRR